MGRKSKIVKLKSDVLRLLKTKKGLTTKDIAEKSRISWNTADKILKKLMEEKKVSRKRYGRVNVWM